MEIIEHTNLNSKCAIIHCNIKPNYAKKYCYQHSEKRMNAVRQRQRDIRQNAKKYQQLQQTTIQRTKSVEIISDYKKLPTYQYMDWIIAKLLTALRQHEPNWMRNNPLTEEQWLKETQKNIQS